MDPLGKIPWRTDNRFTFSNKGHMRDFEGPWKVCMRVVFVAAQEAFPE